MSNKKGKGMPKKQVTGVNLGAIAAMGAAGAAIAMDPLPEAPSSQSLADREEISRLAYTYWVDRGSPDGSPEEDWFHAEKTLQEQAAKTAV